MKCKNFLNINLYLFVNDTVLGLHQGKTDTMSKKRTDCRC